MYKNIKVRYNKDCCKYGIFKYGKFNNYYHYKQLLIENTKNGKLLTYTCYKKVAYRWLHNIKIGKFREFSFSNNLLKMYKKAVPVFYKHY